jgi:hypothetical protein
MALLTKIQASELPSAQTAGNRAKKELKVTLDFGKTAALALIALLVYAGALACYLANQGGGATAFMGVGSLILGAGFGIAGGESVGANEAAAKLG